MTLTVLDALHDVLQRSWQDQRGATLSVRVADQREAQRIASNALGLGAGSGSAVALINVDAGRSLFRDLSTGPSPVLSPPTARTLEALEGSRLAQIRLLERLLRCHARHRAVLLVVDRPLERDSPAKWLLEQLPALLHDTAVTWLFLEHDDSTGAVLPVPSVQRTRAHQARPHGARQTSLAATSRGVSTGRTDRAIARAAATGEAHSP